MAAVTLPQLAESGRRIVYRRRISDTVKAIYGPGIAVLDGA